MHYDSPLGCYWHHLPAKKVYFNMMLNTSFIDVDVDPKSGSSIGGLCKGN